MSGLGLIHILFAPHIVKEPNRIESVKQMMKRRYKIPAVKLDNAALEIIDKKCTLNKESTLSFSLI